MKMLDEKTRKNLFQNKTNVLNLIFKNFLLLIFNLMNFFIYVYEII